MSKHKSRLAQRKPFGSTGQLVADASKYALDTEALEPLDHLPGFLKVLEAKVILVPSAKEAVARTKAHFKAKGKQVDVVKESNNRYLVIPEDLVPLTFVTDRTTTWESVKAFG